MASRGALIVLEGCDKAGKSTHVKLLLDALKGLGKRATILSFPGTLRLLEAKTSQLKCFLLQIELLSLAK